MRLGWLVVGAVAACGGELAPVRGPAPAAASDQVGPPSAGQSPAATVAGAAAPAPFPVCVSVAGDRSATPVDIVWIVDSSPSMTEEMGWIQQNLNDFIAYLTEVTINVKVVLLGGQQICVPAPLAGANCTDGERLRHIRDYVGSHDSLEKMIEFYPRYSDFLRGGRTALVVTTDDDSEVSADWFAGEVASLGQPGFGSDYVVHSIVAYGSHPRGCLTGASPGTVYLELSDETQGIKYPICETDWTRVFAELATGIVGMVNLPCAYAPPSVPEGKTVDPAQIHVALTELGNARVLPQLAGAPDCDVEAGWYYEASTQIVRLCPAVCRSLQASQVQVSFGCREVVN